jgi:hypothetical protein
MGWRIVRHSFILLSRNFSDALRVSIGPLLIGGALIYVALSVMGTSPQSILLSPQSSDDAGAAALVVLFALLIGLFVLSWIAVAWHRFILKEEYPGLIPTLNSAHILPYIGRSIVLALLMTVILLPVAAVAGVVLSALGLINSALAGLVIGFAMGLFFTFVWLRVALVLPATAINEPISIREAWTLSNPASSDILSASVILVGLNIVVGAVLEIFFGPTLMGFIVNLGVSWVTLMIGTSVLTTLYGHLVQGRPLP